MDDCQAFQVSYIAWVVIYGISAVAVIIMSLISRKTTYSTSLAIPFSRYAMNILCTISTFGLVGCNFSYFLTELLTYGFTLVFNPLLAEILIFHEYERNDLMKAYELVIYCPIIFLCFIAIEYLTLLGSGIFDVAMTRVRLQQRSIRHLIYGIWIGFIVSTPHIVVHILVFQYLEPILIIPILITDGLSIVNLLYLTLAVYRRSNVETEILITD
jgi:hypothetical protein